MACTQVGKLRLLRITKGFYAELKPRKIFEGSAIPRFQNSGNSKVCEF